MQIIPNNFVTTIKDQVLGEDNGYETTISYPFPFKLWYAENDAVYPQISGNVPGIDIDRFSMLVPTHTSLNFNTGENYIEYAEIAHLPCTIDEELLDGDELILDIPSTVIAEGAAYNFYVKTDPTTGRVIGIKIQKYIIIGTGFIDEDDPTWKRISTIYTSDLTGTYGNFSVPIFYISNSLSGYSYLVKFKSSNSDGLQLVIIDLDYAVDLEPSLMPHYSNGTINRVYTRVDENVLSYLSQSRENVLNATLFNNAKFVIR